MKISAKSEKGLSRSINQDSYAAGELTGNVSWAVVCDGMGGAAGGNVASATASKLISEKITTCYHVGMSDNSIKNLLVSAIESANAVVHDTASKSETLFGMGTTVVAVIVNGNKVYVASAGDSRAYILSDSIFQITTDHSVVQQMVDNGEITKEEARVHPKKNVITRALGVDKSIRVDFFLEEINREKDIVLICTDGLSNFVSDEDILKLTQSYGKLELADRLAEEACKNGGGDDITVVTLSN